MAQRRVEDFKDALGQSETVIAQLERALREPTGRVNP
jgi:hypothetical protein